MVRSLSAALAHFAVPELEEHVDDKDKALDLTNDIGFFRWTFQICKDELLFFWGTYHVYQFLNVLMRFAHQSLCTLKHELNICNILQLVCPIQQESLLCSKNLPDPGTEASDLKQAFNNMYFLRDKLGNTFIAATKPTAATCPVAQLHQFHAHAAPNVT